METIGSWIILAAIVGWMYPILKWNTWPKKVWAWRVDVLIWLVNICWDLYHNASQWIILWDSLALGVLGVFWILTESDYSAFKKRS